MKNDEPSEKESSAQDNSEILETEEENAGPTQLTTAEDYENIRDSENFYHCNECDYKTNHRKNLVVHINNIHKGIKFACNQCDYQATTNSHLNGHIKAQHMEPQYKCKQCGQNFKHQTALYRHTKIVHEGLRFYCKFCDYSATHRHYVKKHEASHHTSE